MSDHDRLGDALRHQADQLDNQHPFTLADIQGRARGIRRRRMAASGLAAAAVLAVAVPVGLSMTDGAAVDRRDPPVASGNGNPTPTDGATPTPTSGPIEHDVVLTTNVAAKGGEPGIPYLFDGAINLPDGSQVPVSKSYYEVAGLDDGWVAAGYDGQGNGFVDLLDTAGKVTATEPASGGLGVSEDGTVVAWARPNGQIMTKVAGQEPLGLSTPAGEASARSVTGVVGSQDCQEVGDQECVVYFNDSGRDGVSSYASSHGIVDTTGDLITVAGLRLGSADGQLAGLISRDDAGSCSAVATSYGVKQLWKTCDYTLGRFSPDGEYVIGKPAYLDGIGDSFVAILDADDGTVLAKFSAPAGKNVFLNNAVWDTSNTLLATVWDQDHWSLMRMTADGDLSNVSAGGLAGGTDMDQVPLHFSTRP